HEPMNIEARENMALASVMAGVAFSQTGTSAAHAFSYYLTSNYDVPHGEACAFTMDIWYVVNANLDSRLEEHEKMIGFSDAEALSERLNGLKKELGLALTFDDLGIDRSAMETIVERGFEAANMKNNIAQPDKGEVLQFLSVKKVWYNDLKNGKGMKMAEKKYIRVVGAVIMNDDDEILCAQRPEGKNLALKWEFRGGKAEQGETETGALVRDPDEEMEGRINVLDKITTTVYEYDFGIVELTTYYAKILSGEIKMLEHVDMKWMNRENIDALDWAPADIPAIELIQNYKEL